MTTSHPNGWLVLDKPLQISSANALNRIKRLVGLKKLGHAGTLDPMASGVLVVALGEATKAIEFAMSSHKAYEFTITWGEYRDTIDIEGAVIATSDVRPNRAEIEKVLKEFTPSYLQTPPKYSAVKVAGKRAYDMAREGKAFELKPKLVELSEIEVIGHEGDKTTIRICCGKGFYVRSLAIDIAEKLGALGYVSYLRRTRVGNFTAESAISLESLEKLVHNALDRGWEDLIIPIAAVLDDILVRRVSESEGKRLKFGQRVRVSPEGEGEGIVAICGNIPIAICKLEDGVLIPKRIFNL